MMLRRMTPRLEFVADQACTGGYIVRIVTAPIRLLTGNGPSASIRLITFLRIDNESYRIVEPRHSLRQFQARVYRNIVRRNVRLSSGTGHDLLAVRGALGEETDCQASWTGKSVEAVDSGRAAPGYRGCLCLTRHRGGRHFAFWGRKRRRHL